MSDTPSVRANLEWHRKAAKKKLKALRLKKPSAALAEAQLLVAREKGFNSWRELISKMQPSPAVSTAEADADGFLKLVQQSNMQEVVQALSLRPDLVNRVGKHPQWGGRPQPLHVAIERGDKPMFDLLLQSGANPIGDNSQYDLWSPLMLSVHWKRADMRDALRQRIPQPSLIELLMLGDDRAAMKLLIDGTSALPAIVPNNATPLHFTRTVKSAGRLLELGVPIASKDKYGKTPLDVAAEARNRELAKFLLKRGATASIINFARLGDRPQIERFLKGRKPASDLLFPAVSGGHIALVRWLIDKGADVNVTNEKGVTPLHLAAFDGKLAIAKLLVKHGANVHTEDPEYNSTPTGWAQHAAQNLNRTACVAVTGYLQKQEEKMPATAAAKPRKSSKVSGWKPIMDAAFAGDAALVRKLLKAGADPNAISSTAGGHAPLHRAIEAKKTVPRGPGHLAVVKALLAAGANPRQRGGFDRLTSLQLAAMSSPQFVPLLIEAFKPLDLFHAAVVLDCPRVEALLKQDKSSATSTDVNGFTPLHYVAGSMMYQESEKLAADQLKIAQILIDTGAGANATFTWPGPGEWPISVLYMCSGRSDNAALTELLLKAGANPCDNESVYHASDEGHEKCLALFEQYVEPKHLANECTMCLRTQMHWGRSRGAKWLLEHGADPNSLHPQFGNSALHQAALLGSNDKLLKLLLHHGADPNLKNTAGKSVIDLATKAKKSRVVKALTGGGE